MQRFIIISWLVCHSLTIKAAAVKGILVNSRDECIPYASIRIMPLQKLLSANLQGEFQCTLSAGTYTFRITTVGYAQLDTVITIPQVPVVHLRIILRDDGNELSEVVVYHNARDLAREIMQHVRNNRKEYLAPMEWFECRTYHKLSTEMEDLKWNEPDSLEKEQKAIEWRELEQKKRKKWLDRGMDTSQIKYFRHLPPSRFRQIHFTETISDIRYKGGTGYSEKIIAMDEHKAERPSGGDGVSISIGGELGEHEIIPEQTAAESPYILVTDNYGKDFNFYRNLINLPAVCNRPLLSPVASTSAMVYRYELVNEYMTNGKKIYKISVQPVFKSDAAFYGFIYVEDSTWALVSADLYINEPSLQKNRWFHVIQHYTEHQSGVFLCASLEIAYNFRYGKSEYVTRHHIENSNYRLQPEFTRNDIGNITREFTDQCTSYDTSFWNSHRPADLLPREKKYIRQNDSLSQVYESREFLTAMDSAFNHITVWKVLLEGIGYRNSYKGYSFLFDPVINQINPLGIGGYRHKLGVHFKQEFKNGMDIETDDQIDYGFKNHDVKGKIGIGLTYVPKKFIRTYITAGDYYDMVNTYASLGTLFSRSNYVRAQTLSVAQRMEIINGLFAEAIFEFTDQKPITGIKLEQWSNDLFGTNNTPVVFDRYIKSEVRIELKYRHRQKYMIRNHRKIITGSRYPVFHFIYRKGIPGLFNSEVNFDYIEMGVKDDTRMGRWGVSNWSVLTGSFINRSNLRILEYKYFRGSDPVFFSDPVKSFQLLGPTLSTPSEFFRANYIHHFNGAILGMIPLFNRLKLTLAAGASTLLIPEQDFRHGEMYVGLERITRIRRNLIRFSVFAVTSDNNLSKAAWTLKLGINFFNSYTNQWQY